MKRCWELVRNCTNGNLLLLHSLKQSSLSLWRSTVNLVSKEKVTEQWSWFERKFTFLCIIDVGTGDVSREQVRRKLNTLEIATKCIGKGVGHQCLSQTWVIFEQKVTVGKNVDQYIINNVCLTDNYFLDFGTDCLAIAPTAFKRSRTSGLDSGASAGPERPVLQVLGLGQAAGAAGIGAGAAGIGAAGIGAAGAGIAGAAGATGAAGMLARAGLRVVRGWLHVYFPPIINFPNVESAG